MLLAFALVGLVLPAAAASKHGPRTRPDVIAYLFPRDHVIQPGEIAASKLTRINYAFANIQDGQIVILSPADAPNLATLVGLKKENPSLQIVISVGGWLWSGHFSDAALTPESRTRFVDSVVAFVEKYNLDGLDIDWEFPGETGAGNRFRPEDGANFNLLVVQLRQRFNREQTKLGRHLILSMAAGANDDFLQNTPMREIARSLDTVNLMAYDYYEPGDEGTTGNHAPLYTDPTDPRHISADTSVRHCEQAGVPASKIALGVPFYGHVWGHVPNVNHGLFQPGSAAPNTYGRYDMIDNMLKQGFTRYWDDASKVPYLYNPDKQMFVSYEDPESLAIKCAYIERMHLAGIMFWEYNSDPSGALLNAIDNAFSGKSPTNAEGGR